MEKVKAWITNPSLILITAILLFRKQDRKLLSRNSCFWRSRTAGNLVERLRRFSRSKTLEVKKKTLILES
jgi:hypothetical protein